MRYVGENIDFFFFFFLETGWGEVWKEEPPGEETQVGS
jgi:hypothetical protein